MNIIPCFLGVVVLFCVVSFESVCQKMMLLGLNNWPRIWITLSQVDGIFFISIPNFDTNLRVQSNPFLKWWNLLNRRTTPKPYTSVKSCPACSKYLEIKGTIYESCFIFTGDDSLEPDLWYLKVRSSVRAIIFALNTVVSKIQFWDFGFFWS